MCLDFKQEVLLTSLVQCSCPDASLLCILYDQGIYVQCAGGLLVGWLSNEIGTRVDFIFKASVTSYTKYGPHAFTKPPDCT